MDRRISVEGNGTFDADPDSVRLECSLQERFESHAEAVRMSVECVKPLRRALEDAGFQGDILKTASLTVRPVYENLREGDVYRSVFAGFEYVHNLRMVVDSDNRTIDRVLEAIVSTGVRISMTYQLRDPEPAIGKARAMAVEDARAKAEQLAEAAGVKIGRVVSIVYGDDRPSFRAMAVCNGECSSDMVAEKIPFTDSVTVVWEIL